MLRMTGIHVQRTDTASTHHGCQYWSDDRQTLCIHRLSCFYRCVHDTTIRHVRQSSYLPTLTTSINARGHHVSVSDSREDKKTKREEQTNGRLQRDCLLIKGGTPPSFGFFTTVTLTLSQWPWSRKLKCTFGRCIHSPHNKNEQKIQTLLFGWLKMSFFNKLAMTWTSLNARISATWLVTLWTAFTSADGGNPVFHCKRKCAKAVSPRFVHHTRAIHKTTMGQDSVAV